VITEEGVVERKHPRPKCAHERPWIVIPQLDGYKRGAVMAEPFEDGVLPAEMLDLPWLGVPIA